MASNRPTRTIRPAQKLNEDNIGTLQLASHRNFVKAAKDPKTASSHTSSNAEPTQGLVPNSVPEPDKRDTTSAAESPPVIASNNKNLSSSSSSECSSETDLEPQRKPTKKPKKKKKKQTAQSKSLLNSSHSSFLINLIHINIR